MLIQGLPALKPLLSQRLDAGDSLFIILDHNTQSHCLPLLLEAVPELRSATLLEVPDGELAKQLDSAKYLWSSLGSADRHSLIVNLGGGSVSDLGGFVAASLLRGIDYINIPTTLLAMVDAAIGGKVALNLDNIKNRIGFFYNPIAVCLDPVFLNTLPPLQYTAGLCEALKTFLLNPENQHLAADWLSSFNALSAESLIFQSASFKLSLVEQDPCDRGVRQQLNLGHTFAHAIETLSLRQRRPVPHGIAVGIGIAFSLQLSHQLYDLPDSFLAQYSLWLSQHRISLPLFSPDDRQELLSVMHSDKKNLHSQIRLSLLRNIGDCLTAQPVSDDLILAALSSI